MIQTNKSLPTTSFIKQRQWIVTPTMGSFPMSNFNTNVRFDIKTSQKAFFDPRSSYIEVQISIPTSTIVGQINLDSDPLMLISDFRASFNGQEIQRVSNFHKMFGAMHSLGGIKQRCMQNCAHMIIPRKKMPTNNQAKNVSNFTTHNGPPNQQGPYTTIGIQSTGFIPTQFPGALMGGSNSNQQWAVQQIERGKMTHLSSQNPCYTNPQYTSMKDPFNNTSYGANYLNNFGPKNMRYQYIEANSKGIQSTSSINNSCMQVSTKTINNQYPFKFSEQNPYLVQYNPTRQVTLQAPDVITPQQVTVSNNVAYCGFSSNFIQQLYAYDPNITLSNTVPSVFIQNGQIIQMKNNNKCKIRIPIPSSIFGILIPDDQYKRIPMQFIKNWSFDFYFNKYAFYSSGYADYCQYDEVGMGIQIPRSYIINNVTLNFDVYDYVMSPLNYSKILGSKQIIQTECYQILRQQTFQDATSITGSYSITLPYSQMTQIIVIFYAGDYHKYNFTRMNQKINVGMQQLNIQYQGYQYPQIPYRGNAGNPISTNVNDNFVFLQNLKRSTLYNNQNCLINTYNFALNGRIYDPTNQNTLYNASTFQCQQMGSPQSMNVIYQNPVNFDTALGQSQFNQQRGKSDAVFVIPFNGQVIMGQNKSISCLDIKAGQTITLNMIVNQQVNFTRSVQMVVFGCFRRRLYQNLQKKKIYFTDIKIQQ